MGLEMVQQGVAAVALVDHPAPTRIVPAQLAQALPADLEQAAGRLGEDGGRSRHPTQGRDLAEDLAGPEADAAVAIEDGRDVLQKGQRPGVPVGGGGRRTCGGT